METLESYPTPELFKSSGSFDLTIALSFFSHLPDESFARWLIELFATVKPGGILAFTTHGRLNARLRKWNRRIESGSVLPANRRTYPRQTTARPSLLFDTLPNRSVPCQGMLV